MENEKMVKLQHFFAVDVRIKSLMYDIAPQSLGGYTDESSLVKYSDRVNDA